jgi:hypothetical protein
VTDNANRILVQRFRDSNRISNLGPRPEEARASSKSAYTRVFDAPWRAVSKDGHRRRSPRPFFETVTRSEAARDLLRMRSVLVARYDRFHGIAVLVPPSGSCDSALREGTR